MLGIIGAMDSEVDNLTERLTGRRAATAAGRVFYTGRKAASARWLPLPLHSC